MENNNGVQIEQKKKTSPVLIALLVVLVIVAIIIGFKFGTKASDAVEGFVEDQTSTKLENYELYNKVSDGILVVSTDGKNRLNDYAVCSKSCETESISINLFSVNEEKELVYSAPDGKKYKLTDNVKSINVYSPDEDDWFGFDVIMYETLDGEKYLLTDDNKENKLASINVKKIYGIVAGMYLVNDAEVVENIAKYNNNVINAKNVYYGKQFDFSSDSNDETASTIYVFTSDKSLLYSDEPSESWNDTKLNEKQLSYEDPEGGIEFKGKNTKIKGHIVY